jgi:thiol:disulfide interchange protein DsbA
LIFFDFACPFSASFHGAFVSFLTTVPSKVQASFVPVVNPADTPRLKEQAIAAQCFYAAAAHLSASQMSVFMSAVYADYAQRLDLTSKAMWTNACGAAGLSLKKFSASLAPKVTQPHIQYAALKTSSYALTATPSVAVGGAYVITPEEVKGDMEMYFNLLNGLTSRLL